MLTSEYKLTVPNRTSEIKLAFSPEKQNKQKIQISDTGPITKNLKQSQNKLQFRHAWTKS